MRLATFVVVALYSRSGDITRISTVNLMEADGDSVVTVSGKHYRAPEQGTIEIFAE